MSKLFLSFVSNLALLCLPIGGDFDGGSSMCVTAFQNWPSFAFRHRLNIPADSDSVGRHSRRIVRAVTRSSDLPPKSGSDSTTRRQLNTARPIKTAEKNKSPNNEKRPFRKNNDANSLNSDIFRLRKQKNGVELAEQRLQKAIDEMLENSETVKELLQSKNNTKKLQKYPDEVSFNSILSSHAKNARRDSIAAAKAGQLVDRMVELADEFPHLRPSIFTYNALLEAYTKNCNSNNPKRAQQSRLAVLRIFRKVQRDPQLEANSFTNNLLLTSNAITSPEWYAVERWALDYLDNPTYTAPIPDRNTYNQLLQCYASQGDADKAEDLLQKIINSTESKRITDDSLKVCPVWFNLVFKALASSSTGNIDGHIMAGDRADRLLRQMYDLYKSGYDDKILPGTSTYNHVLNVHTLSGNTERAECLVAELENAFLTNALDDIVLQPDRITFTTLIKTYATKQRNLGSSSSKVSYDIAVNATRVFETMESLSNAGWKNMSPTDVTYNTLISIWANVGTRESLRVAAKFFQQMCEDPENPPDSVTYTTLIHGWARGVRHLARLPEAGYRTEQLLQQLEQLPPSRQRKDFSATTVYNSVITAWSRSGESVAAEKVESLLSRLEGKYFNGLQSARPNKTTFLCMIGTYAKARIPDAAVRCDALLQRMMHYRDNLHFHDLEPDQAVYNAVLNALAKSYQSTAVEAAEEILTMMQTSPDKKLRPDIVTYATVIDCHTKCGEGSSDRAQELLRFVEGTYRNGDKTLEPNAVFYSAILQAWAKTATIEGATKAEELLRRNIALYEEGYAYAKPHAIMYNAVMDAIARSGDPTSGIRAEELLNEMESLYQGGDEELRPTRRSLNAVILAYRNAGDGGKKAEELLCRMEDLAESGRPELTPDVVSYNCAISAIVENGCRGGDDDNGAADRAQALLDRMESRNIQPDGRTYRPVIEAWLKRSGEKGDALAEMMLQQFLDKVDSKKKGPGQNQNLYEDAVWDVINAYRKSEE